MTGPFIFVGSHRVREGKLDEFRADAVSLAKLVEDREPQLLGFNIYLSEDGTEATVVQIHPDADSMLAHMQVASEHIEKGRRNCSIRRRSASSVRRMQRCST